MQKKRKSGAAVLNNLDDGWQNRRGNMGLSLSMAARHQNQNLADLK